MTEIHLYECDYCGKKFEDEDECSEHEWKHQAEKVEGELLCWNTNGFRVPFERGAFDEIFYVRWKTRRAIEFFIEWATYEFGWRNNLINFDDCDTGSIFYDDRKEEWVSVDEFRMRLAKILSIVGED